MPKYPEFKAKPIIGLEEENWGKLSTAKFNRAINTDWEVRNAKIDWESARNKAIANTNYQARTNNFDYKEKVKNTNYKNISKKISKPILQFDLQGNFIQEFESVKAAKISLGKSKYNGDISNCLKGNQKTALGYIWEYKLEQE